MTSRLPRNEGRRLRELRRHEIMDTAPEPAFERIVRVASRFFAMPMAAVTFVDEFRVWLKASHGMTLRESPREGSFCAQAILREGVFVVRDARADGWWPARTGGEGPDAIRFYAGAPLRVSGGQTLGVLCVMDTAPREFTAEDEETLADLGALAVDALELRRLTAQLRAEIDGGRRAQRALARQHQLLQRLSQSQEDRIQMRTDELMRVNDSLRAEIAHRERVDAALQRAKEKAEQANAAKSEFLSRLSHELRTPLNAVLGFGRILQGTLSGEAQRDCAGHVVTAGRHLLGLINEVLDIARIEAGHVELSLEPVRVSEIIGETLDLLRPLVAERGITVEVAGADDVGRAVLADRQRFKQILLNLLSNAIKYGPAAGRVGVRCVRPNNTRAVRIEVTDQGPGFSREQARRLFVAFDRLGAERSGVQGTGLGLALSKRLVEAMGGKIGVRTASTSGSTFWICLPLSRAGGAAPLPADAPPLVGRTPARLI